MTAVAEHTPRDAEHKAAVAHADQRADIQALRALAVGAVVLFHLWPNRVSGGYVGVDVFFVISGFLITGRLAAEAERSGRVSLPSFWARRAKRLVPASMLVLASILVALVAAVPKYLWQQFVHEIIASALQIQNWVLAHDAVDYFAAHNVASPTQHYWSLAVEEQFYVALPLIVAACCLAARAFRRPPVNVLRYVLFAVIAVSFALSVVQTPGSPGLAYFSTLTRAWEFAIGGALALARYERYSAPRLVGLGIAGIVVTSFWYDGGTAFPGYAAVIPVLGTAFAIGGRAPWLERLGERPAVARLGRVSYSVYLWHWPMIVLVPFFTDRPLGTLDKLGILVATALVAEFSTRVVEDPLRYHPKLLGSRRPRVVGIVCALIVASVLVGAKTVDHRRNDESAVADARRARFSADPPHCLGAQSMDPKLAPCTNPQLPPDLLVPEPVDAIADDDNRAECWGIGAHGPNICSFGPKTGWTKRVFAVGDSHNNELVGFYRRLANHRHWRIDITGLGGCYLTTSAQIQPSEKATRTCMRWHDEMIAIANGSQGAHYDAIIVTHSSRDRLVIAEGGHTVEQETVRGLVEAWNRLPKVPILAIRDNPAMPKDFLTCVSRNGVQAASKCAPPRVESLLFDGHVDAARQVPRARVVDMTDFYCTATVCPPVIGHVLVYRDQGHVTGTWAATLSPYLETRLVAAYADAVAHSSSK